jgi:leader peptidase (prepilin peptidase)/N-methyltransferase
MFTMAVVILVVFGLCFGSFINAYVWRIHSKTKTGRLANLSVWRGRSMCPNCHHELASKDLIPVISWLTLGGKCRYCHKPISFQYPLVELLTTFLFVFSYIYWPYGFKTEGIVLFIFWLIFILGFMCLTIFDLRWRILPNRIIMPLIFLAIAQIIVQLIFFNADLNLLVGSIWGVIFSAGLFYGIFVLSKGTWIGGGDVKLAIVLGIILGGPLEAILMIFLSSLLGILFAVGLVLANKTRPNRTIPYGPMLMLATVICYLFGVHIIDWYKSIII